MKWNIYELFKGMDGQEMMCAQIWSGSKSQQEKSSEGKTK